MYLGINNLQFVDQRAFQRINSDLKGRFLLSNGEEYDCLVKVISPGGLCAFCDANNIIIGEIITVLIDEIGRIKGKVINFDDKRGYVIQIIASENTKRKLAEKIMLIANKDDIEF
ncbi:MAG: hypothetical protein C4617_04990 [Candidatus Liberibacter europaeus]|uniref:PilZ domain-containing protein n=1 Tax=Candidatus Liberibacter europaeus TaxID=744859 RepID=A0A2T4VWT1_9HYPH|nr:hypothetical protein [Candidatus Liberibacter europaeus]PTL86228.1 MAG: hypothetical protein C4617_04990 [Candidatus Liberibacter europaeus]